MNNRCEGLAPKDIEVDVRASLNADGSIHFDSVWRRSDDPKDVWYAGTIDLPLDSGEHRLDFRLDDRSGRKLQFCADAKDAIWVDVNECPTGPAGDDVGQIKDKQVDAGKKKLTVKDLNDNVGECILHYALRFDGDPSPDGKHTAPYMYDPDIKNGGVGNSR